MSTSRTYLFNPSRVAIYTAPIFAIEDTHVSMDHLYIRNLTD